MTSSAAHIHSTSELPCTRREQHQRRRRCLQRLPGAATAEGPEYEWKLGGMLALRAYKRGVPFELFSNVAAAWPFDDLVLRLLEPCGAATYFVQLKHSRARGKRKAVGHQAFTNDSGDFSLRKYFHWYEEFRELYSAPAASISDDQRVLLETPLDGTRLVLFTTKEVRRPGEEEEEGKEEEGRRRRDIFPFDDIFSTNDDEEGNAITFNSTDTQIWGLFDDHDVSTKTVYCEEFLEKLKIFHKQACSRAMDEIIKTEMTQVFGRSAEKIFGSFMTYLKVWCEKDINNFCLSNQTLLDFFGQQLRNSAVQSVCADIRFKVRDI